MHAMQKHFILATVLQCHVVATLWLWSAQKPHGKSWEKDIFWLKKIINVIADTAVVKIIGFSIEILNLADVLNIILLGSCLT